MIAMLPGLATIGELKAAAKEHFRARGLGGDDQCRIALLIQAIKSANAMILAKVELQALDWWAYRLLHDQYFKETEMATLLARTARWTLNPGIYWEAARIAMKLWQDARIARHLGSLFVPSHRFFEYLALSHAFMAEIRFLPLLPTTWNLATPFLYALNEIEEENGRQIQAQIRLLKDVKAPAIAPAERERIVEQQRDIVIGLFAEFLRSLLAAA